jgi:hypothetical protein
MAVVINDFEVVTQPAPAKPAADAPAAEPARPATAGDVERTLAVLHERALRLRAD